MLCVAAGPDAGVAAEPKPVMLIASGPDVFDKWITAKPEQRAAVKGFTDKLKIGERYAFAAVIEGYELPKSRMVDLTADVQITDPTGRVVTDKVSMFTAKTWDPKKQFVVPMKPAMTLYFGTTDPEGQYDVKITVWDQVRGTHVELKTQFTVTR